MTVDTKISEFDQQIKFLKEENTLLKSNEGESSKEIAMIRDERDRYRKDYKTIKQVNKALERDLKEVAPSFSSVLITYSRRCLDRPKS